MRQLLFIVLLILASALLAPAQTINPEAIKELNDGAIAYRAGRFVEAQQHFERALAIDPTSKNAPLFIARAIHSQYRLGIDTPENNAIALAAIEAYKKVFLKDPESDDAFNAVAYLYRQLK